MPDLETLRALINEGDESGPLEPMESAAQLAAEARAAKTAKPANED